MKKLNLKNLKLSAEDVLQRDRLRSIFGGCGMNGYTCNNGNDFCDSKCLGTAQCISEYGLGYECKPRTCPTNSSKTQWICKAA
ncbi:hypothetical protein [Maribacter sp.]